MPGSDPLLVRILNRVPASASASFASTSCRAKLLRPLVNRLVPSQEIEVAVRAGAAEGLRLVIDPKTEKYYWTGAYEREVQDVLQQILAPGDVFWDVGAHIGFFTLIASRLVGDQGEVRAFEPVAANLRRLHLAIEANGVTNVTVHPTAVAACVGSSMLFAHRASNMWTLVPALGERQHGTIPTTTLDELERSFGCPRLIKVDVEGAELDVLRGAVTLSSHHAPPMVIEFSEPALVTEAQALMRRYRFNQLAARQWLLLSR